MTGRNSRLQIHIRLPVVEGYLPQFERSSSKALQARALHIRERLAKGS